jgi:hypothetical protein
MKKAFACALAVVLLAFLAHRDSALQAQNRMTFSIVSADSCSRT